MLSHAEVNGSIDIVVDERYPTSVRHLYELMFDSDWFISFLEQNQGVHDLNVGDWEPVGQDSGLLRRELRYVKPVSGPGPREVYCEDTEENLHRDDNDFILTRTITKTPNVTYGGAFHVETTTRVAWAADRKDGCALNVTSEVIWTSWCPIKGLIEGRVLNGQRSYQRDLDAALRDYLGSPKRSLHTLPLIANKPPSAEQLSLYSPINPKAVTKSVKLDLEQPSILFTSMTSQIDKAERELGTPGAVPFVDVSPQMMTKRRVTHFMAVFLFSALITLLIVRLTVN
ncbi:uncharacterized protein EI90DRAFT_3125080 [Cantharellus anzutake]|uniref:uncharacterized protein n=1 Tax=Cantharellus anzutake TaxID=1750568 RepID=UPI001905A4ED|nr:uncharacterized protein EI90DRAFT_3125080 [Cantharellus anzutake]KAF8329820.1 hypothetical protein EI90DRAFT_3125080 [Cantharellus anzutake]